MASNYQGAVQALDAMYGAQQLQRREAALLQILLCAQEQAWKRKDATLAQRLTKAARLVQTDAVSQDETAPDTYLVRSQSEPQHTFYTVHGVQCECEDSRKHQDQQGPHYCKHLCACLLYQRLQQWLAAH